MTLRFAYETLPPSMVQNHAGSKAHDDIQLILSYMGLQGIPVRLSPTAWRLPGTLGDRCRAVSLIRQWRRVLVDAQEGDVVVFQHPSIHEIPRFANILDAAKRRGVRMALLIHDLELFRLLDEGGDPSGLSGNLGLIERRLIADSCAIIAHNEAMKARLVKDYGVDPSTVVPLGIFDYLLPAEEKSPSLARAARDLPVVIAGNLDPAKAGYAYHLPPDVPFNLYGPNYRGEASDNVHYRGSFPADELIGRLEGSFGLVWDGGSAETCAGVFGRYLRINNPHKTSLYLAAGMPVIIWDQAALAPFVTEHHVGFVVSSLADIGGKLRALDPKEYELMRENAAALSAKLRSGWFTRQAVESVKRIAGVSV